jgi:CheY-like chemotaxis protein
MASQRTVLVIEDDLSFRRTITAYLTDSGYRIIEAAEGREGTILFQQEKPDLVITDLRMPVMDGFEFIAWLKLISPATPVLAISGTADQKAVAAALTLGAQRCILKPILDLSVLENAIEQVLSRGI